MDPDELNLYQQQLIQINNTLCSCSEGPEKEELLTLKANIEELLELTTEDSSEKLNTCTNSIDDEFAAFMEEMEKEGAVETKSIKDTSECNKKINLEEIEGKKCKAPHHHHWGNVTYHNAMICSVVSNENEELKVRVLFINPTHQEMLPCPFYYNSDCKFSEEQCKFSHGEIVPYSSLQEYVEPNFDQLEVGSSVLAKQNNNLWYRAHIKSIHVDKCLVKFDNSRKEQEVNLEHIYPLENCNGSSDDDNDGDDTDDNENLEAESNQEDIINMSLTVKPMDQRMGDWEKHTKGMGSKLMMKMGYIIGTGLGKRAEGIINPVSAVIFPTGKSIDYCMNLRERSGGDKDLFSVERKMKRIQRKQENQSRKAYERDTKKEDLFTFINKTVQATSSQNDKLETRQDIKNESSRDLNIKSMTIQEDIRKAERELDQLQSSLARHTDQTSDINKKIREKTTRLLAELTNLQKQAQMIKNEQGMRENKRKLTVF